MRFQYAPRWVNIVYSILEWIDYHIVDNFSGWLTDKRVNLLDRHCRCDQCLKRAMEREAGK